MKTTRNENASAQARIQSLCFAVMLAVAGTSVLGCNRPTNQGAPEQSQKAAPASSAAAPSPSAAPGAGAPKLEERPFRFPAAPRVVAIGDLHGDLSATRAALRLAGAIDDKDHWSGGKLVVVQTGDQLDRGDDERKILDLLEQLTAEANAAGGALHILNGNHEAMNALGDFRYVTPQGFTSFEGVTPSSPYAERFPSEQRGRAGAFLPGGKYAALLAERDVIAVVGDTAFVHGGIRPPHVDYGIARLNAEMSAFLLGKLPQPPRLITDPEGPVWTRVYGAPELDAMACAVLARALEKLAVKRMVVGHTVQEKGISAACDDRVFRIDVGLSHYYGAHPIQVLEIKRDESGKETAVPLSAPRAK